MSKKAQITIFIVIGVVLLIFAGFILYYNLSSKEVESEIGLIGLDTSPVQSFIESCSSHVLADGIKFLRYRGGYYNLPEDSTLFSLNAVPYYYHFSRGDLSPSQEDIEMELSAYIEDNIEYCLKGLVMFTD